MTKQTRVVRCTNMLSTALNLLATAKISELPVVDHNNAPVGIIDVTDVLELVASHRSEKTDGQCYTDDGPTILPIS